MWAASYLLIGNKRVRSKAVNHSTGFAKRRAEGSPFSPHVRKTDPTMNLIDSAKTCITLGSANHTLPGRRPVRRIRAGIASSVKLGGGCMLTYHFDRLQDDGSWFGYDFTATNDDDAVTYALRKRTSNRCELYQGERPLASFDGTTKKEEPTADDVHTGRRTAELAWEACQVQARSCVHHSWCNIQDR